MPAAQDLSIRQLQYVVAVADALGFRKAADACHVSQPTLSAQVQQVEAVLGVAIFERDKRRVLLTPAGDAIVARARRVLLEVDDLLAEAKQSCDPYSGNLRVGVIPTIAPYLLPDVMPALSKKYPKLRFVFREDKTADVVRALAQGELDAGLIALEADVGECASAVVMRDPFVVALPKGHPLVKKRRVSLGDLEQVDVLLLDDGHCFREQALSVCAKSGASEVDFRATSLATLSQMVSAGAGVTLLPSLALDVENRRGQLEIRALAPPAPSRTIALIWRPGSPLAEPLEEIASVMRQAVHRPQHPKASRERTTLLNSP